MTARSRLVASWLLVAGSIALVAASPVPGARAANVLGVVVRGPVAPVCREGVRCDEPAAGVRLAITRNGLRAASVRTDPAGRFALRLPPGRYVVRLERRPAVGGFAPVGFAVRQGHVTRLRLSIDTGIR